MIGKSILIYKYFEKLGEVPKLSTMRQQVETILSIPPKGVSSS